MPGGLLSLVCYGNENIIVNGNPQSTHFYKTFMRYTHFSQEPIQITLDGPDTLLMDAPIIRKAKIPRQGDLLSDLVFRFTLPDIFSKAYLNVSGGTLVMDRAYEFAWVRYIGARIIDTVTFTIGGQKIQEFNSDWIIARAALDYDVTQFQKWRYLVGDVPECFDPANGMYASPHSGYPNVLPVRDSSGNPLPVQNNSPSIPGRQIRLPLGLWFSDYIHNSLPLVGLQYHECEITIKLRPIRELYTVLDPNGVRLRYGTQRLDYLESDQYTNTWKSAQLGPLPDTLNNLYGSVSDPRGALKHFLTDFGNVPFAEGWPLNARLEGLYTFVTQAEQKTFSEKALRYNIRQIQNFTFAGIATRETHRLDVHNIATRVVFFARRSDAIPYRNQATNLTNWINTQGSMRPIASTNPLTTTDISGVPTHYYVGGKAIPIGTSGLNIPGLQRNILRNVLFTANGQPLLDSIDHDYFSSYVAFRYLKGYGNPFSDLGLATQTEMWPIYTYSFGLHPSSVETPSGTLNTSRIDRLEIDVDIEPIPVSANYTYELQVFVETLNFLDITNGQGGLKFAK